VDQYVTGDTAIFPYMMNFWRERPQNKPLVITVRAVSLAYLSVRHQDQNILHRARLRYGSALKLINSDLQTMETAKTNAILMSVLLLDLFEKFNSQLVGDGSSSSKHIDGALALLNLHNLNDDLRLRMSHQLCLKILLNCVKNGFSVPSELLALHRAHQIRGPEWQAEELLIRFVGLQDGLKSGETAAPELIDEALAELHKVDHLYKIFGKSFR
jgi:hypothetical protein